MFDPIFSLLFLGAVVVPTAAIVYWTSKRYLSSRSAFLMAFVVPVAGLAGFFGSVAVLINFATLFWLDTPPMIRLGISFGTAVLMAWLLGGLVWFSSRRKEPN